MTIHVLEKAVEYSRAITLHSNWLIYATFGADALSSSEMAELYAYGKLPMGESLNLIDKAYALGRLRSLSKASEFKNVSTVPPTDLSDPESLALAAVKAKVILKFRRLLMSNAFDIKKLPWMSSILSEFQNAKIQGIANTISNRVGLYAGAVDAEVSVIPAKNCCLDCKRHYLTSGGNPLVFKLADLMSNGSNMDAGVIHTKASGIHLQWKATLPPLHPNCGCMLVYVPPGHGWVDGKLSVLNKSLFTDYIAKATAGVRGPGLESTVAPAGAPSQRQEAGHPSVPGAAAPGNVAGPGRPSGSLPKPGSGSGGSGGGMQFAPCPFGGGAECLSHGGNGAAMHKPNGAIMKKHQEAMARGAKPTTPQAIEAQRKQLDAESVKFNAQPNPKDVLLDHLSEGHIGSAKKLGDEEHAGVSDAYKINITGNGSACMKPPMRFSDMVYSGFTSADGGPNLPKNSTHQSEAAAYNLSSSLGLNHVPSTVSRDHDGSEGVPHVGPTSVQQWKDDHLSIMVTHPEVHDMRALMNIVPAEHRESVKQKLHEIACLDFVMNNNDRHFGNLLFNKDLTDVASIDNSMAFSAGMAGSKNMVHARLHQSGESLKVPDHLLQRFKTQTFEATKRATPNLQPWQQVQTHVRMKYIAHLQETYGHVPIETTRYAAVHAASRHISPEQIKDIRGSMYSAPSVPGWPRDEQERKNAMNNAHDNWEMPDQLYARFAKAYVSGQIPDVEDATQLKEFRPAYPTGSGHALGSSSFDADSVEDQAHQKFWNEIPEWGGGMSSWKKENSEVSQPLRTPPELPGPKTAPGKKRQRVAPSREPTAFEAARTHQPTEFEAARTHLKLEDDEHFKFNDDGVHELKTSDLEEIKPKQPPPPPIKKSLVLMYPNAKFPLT